MTRSRNSTARDPTSSNDSNAEALSSTLMKTGFTSATDSNDQLIASATAFTGCMTPPPHEQQRRHATSCGACWSLLLEARTHRTITSPSQLAPPSPDATAEAVARCPE